VVTLSFRNRELQFGPRPLVMGIVNLGADSFSGDGTPEIDAAVDRARAHLAAGAEIIDVGAESARTNRTAISAEEEAAMLIHFIERWPDLRGSAPADAPLPLLSINTWRSDVVRKVLPCGGDLLNDISGLTTDENARLCAEYGAALLIMHSVGEPKVPHTHVAYDDIMERLAEFFTEKLAMCDSARLPRNATVIDPGIDFAKQRDDNLRIYRELSRLQQFERPILVPVSRKTVIGDVLGLPNPADRDAGTVACIVQGMLTRAQIFRVHNVRAAVQAVGIVAAIEGGH
jgi:dihydropteroate synthase